MSELIKYLDIKAIVNILDNCGIKHENLLLPYLHLCLEKIIKYPKLLEYFIKENINYQTTKYHSENLITHCYCVGYIMQINCHIFSIDPYQAFETGFFHDIGKVWAKKTFLKNNKKKIFNYKGHAQIGENVCNRCFDLNDEQLWAISNHMCSCCHLGNLDKYTEIISSYHYLTFNENTNINNYFNLLHLLSFADQLGRKSNEELDKNIIMNHSLEWNKKLIHNNNNFNNIIKNAVNIILKNKIQKSMIIHTVGHSGFGKSTFSNDLINELKLLNISYDYLERDQCYYEVYRIEKNILLEECITITYSEIYNYISDNNLKKRVQDLWIDKLNTSLNSNSFIKIIDTVQYLYPKAWISTINNLNLNSISLYESSFKIGYYGFPEHLLNSNIISKISVFINLPIDENDQMIFPDIVSEFNEQSIFKPFNLDVGYGRIKPIINTIKNIYSNIICESVLLQQQHISILVNKIIETNKNISEKNLLLEIENKFPEKVLIINKVYDDNIYSYLTFTYRDGFQNYRGPSRDYRGETLLYNKKENTINIIRVTLPIMVDFNEINKDILAEKAIVNSNEFIVLPKFDGSLFVLVYCKNNSLLYNNLNLLINKNIIDSKTYIINKYGLWCFGSKN